MYTISKKRFFDVSTNKDCKNINLLGPFHAQDEMIIAKSLYTLNSSGGIFTVDKVDECKTLQTEDILTIKGTAERIVTLTSLVVHVHACINNS